MTRNVENIGTCVIFHVLIEISIYAKIYDN